MKTISKLTAHEYSVVRWFIWAIVCIILLFAITVTVSSKASAISKTLPDPSDAAFGVSNTRIRNLVTAHGDLEAPVAYAYFYVPVGQTSITVNVRHADNCGYGSISPSADHIDAGYYYQVTYLLGSTEYKSKQDNCSSTVSDPDGPDQVMTFALSGTYNVINTAIGSFQQVVFSATMAAGTNFSENAFGLQVQNSGAWAGYAGDLYGNNTDQPFAIANIQGSGNDLTIDVGLEFGVPCNGDVTDEIWSWDDDFGRSFQLTAITWEINSRPRANNGGEAYSTPEASGSLTGGDSANIPITVPGGLSKDKDYFIIFKGIRRQNGIQFRLPFPQIEAYTPPCDPPEPKGTLSCKDATATTITVSWTTENTTNARIRRGSTTVGSYLSATGSSDRTDTGLNAGTSYTYILRNNSDTANELARVTCTTGPPTTSCTASDVSGYRGESISFSATITVTNGNSSYTLKGRHQVGSGGYTDWGAITGTTFSGSETFTTVGDKTITINVGLFNPSNAANPTTGTTDTCDLTITVRNRTVTCPSRTDNSWINQPRSYSTTLTNPGVQNQSVTVSASAPATAGSVNPTSIGTVTASTADNTSVSTIGTANDITGAFVITWTITTPNANAAGTGDATSTCTTTITKHAPPVCVVENTVFGVGEWVQTRAVLRFSGTYTGSSTGGATINVADDVTRYRYSDGYTDTITGITSPDAQNNTYSGNNLSTTLEGQSTRTGDSFIRTENSGRTAVQRTYEDGSASNGFDSGSTRVIVPGLYGDLTTPNAVTWFIDWRDGDYDPPDIECNANLSVTIEPLVCTPISNPFSINVPSRASTSLENNNKIDVRVYVDGDTASSTFNAPTAIPPTNGNIIVNRTDTTSGSAVGASAVRGYETDRDLTYDATGIYLVEWTIRTQYAAIDSDGNPHPLYSANPTDASCSDTEIEVSRRPYMRLYGNDVVAGSVLLGSGEECTTAGLTSVSDVGITSVGNVNEDGYYQGSAAEMAAIATGTISDFLPGTGSYLRSGEEVYPSTPLRATQEITSGFDYLAIAGGGTSLVDIGGDYDGGGLCNTIFPDPDDFDDTGSIKTGSDFRDGDRIDPDGIDDLQGIVPVNGTSGTRARIFVIGDVTIVGNITYEGANSWASTEQIPLFALYATGNITINGSVTELDGLYVAGGDIHTCSEFMETTDPAEVSAVTTACGTIGSTARQLTLRGAFVANNIVFGRTPGDVSFSNDDPLNADDTLRDPEIGFAGGRKAERLHFYPELYIALWDLARSEIGEDGGGDPAGSFDYISSPPPVF